MIQLSNLPHHYIILGKHLIYKAIIYMKQGLLHKKLLHISQLLSLMIGM